MKNTSLSLILGSLLLASSAIAVVPPTREHLENHQAEFEERYQDMRKHGLSETEILKVADEWPTMVQQVLRDCKNEGKVSPATSRKIVQATVDSLGVKDSQEKEKVARKLEQIDMARRTEYCSDASLVMVERMLLLCKEFQKFVHQKQSIQE